MAGQRDKDRLYLKESEVATAGDKQVQTREPASSHGQADGSSCRCVCRGMRMLHPPTTTHPARRADRREIHILLESSLIEQILILWIQPLASLHSGYIRGYLFIDVKKKMELAIFN